MQPCRKSIHKSTGVIIFLLPGNLSCRSERLWMMPSSHKASPVGIYPGPLLSAVSLLIAVVWLTLNPSLSECPCLVHRPFAGVSFFFAQVGDCWSLLGLLPAQSGVEGGGNKEKKLIIQVWKNALGLHLENSLQKPGQNQWSEALLSLVVLSVRNLDALKMIPGTHPASLTVDDQLKNSRIQQQSWEIIFIYIFITNIFSNRALFSWRADPSCLL